MIVGLLILQSYRQMTPLSRHTEVLKIFQRCSTTGQNIQLTKPNNRKIAQTECKTMP